MKTTNPPLPVNPGSHYGKVSLTLHPHHTPTNKKRLQPAIPNMEQRKSWHVTTCHTLHQTFPYMVYDVTALCMTTPLATLSACSQRPTPGKYSKLYSSMTHGNTLYYIVPHLHHGWPTSTSYLFLTDGVTVPSPSPFPYTR